MVIFFTDSFEKLTICCIIITMKKKDKLFDPTVDKFMTAFTQAQAESLVVVFRRAAIPEDEWKSLAGIFAKANDALR